MFDRDGIQKQQEQVELSQVPFWRRFRTRLWKPIIWLFALLSAVNTLLDLYDHWEQWQPQAQELYIAFRTVVVTPAVTSLRHFALSLWSVLLTFANAFFEGAALTALFFLWAILVADGLLLVYAEMRGKPFPPGFSETVIRESLASFLLHRKSDGTVSITRRGVVVALAVTLAVGVYIRPITTDSLQQLPIWGTVLLVLFPFLAILWRASRTYPVDFERNLGLSLLSRDLWSLDPQKVEQFTCGDDEREHFKTCARAFRVRFMEDDFGKIYGTWQLDYDLKACALRMYVHAVWSGNAHRLSAVIWAVYDEGKNKWCIVDCAIGFDSQDWNIVELRSPHRKRSWPKMGQAFIIWPRKGGGEMILTGPSGMDEEQLWETRRFYRGISYEEFDAPTRKQEAQKQ